MHNFLLIDVDDASLDHDKKKIIQGSLGLYLLPTL